MSRPSPPINSKVYHGETFLGEVDVFPTKAQGFQFPNNEIRISHLSPPTERCPPLSVLHTVSPFSVPCKIQAKTLVRESPIYRLYYSCYNEGKTAIVVFGDRELHLVAMPSKTEKHPCFWCCFVQPGLYNSCLGMLNVRCLSIVFDLDETLIVANTMKSFEDRIEVLSGRIELERDHVRISGMSAELKRYIEDRDLLKQYIETDTVMDNGRSVGVQREEVLPLPDSQESIFRPVIRLQEKGVVLTRINPEIRDTSVIVRLRPAWEDLRSYLTAKERKRFEVYVCTMAERDYALEMWRLLDPEARLISSKQLLDRVRCVKSGSRKSLQQVFQDGVCHPKMAMVIDDRLQVWDDMDQPRVHVVPPFAPYYAPQAEMASAVPVLCVARNVACNVRGGFFKEFDENLLHKIFELCYENEILDLPCAPDVSDYLTPEDIGGLVNNSRDVPMSGGANDVEIEQKLNIQENLGDALKPQNQGQFTRSFSVLEEIGRRCSSKIEFRAIVGSSKDSLFQVEVLFSAERIAIGMGRTRKEAQQQAAENALRNLASNYMSFIALNSGGMDKELTGLSLENGNGFLDDTDSPAFDESSKKGDLHIVNTSEQLGQSDDSDKLSSIISSIKELCAESQSIVFIDQPPASMTLSKGEHYFQVELAGQVLGKGLGSSRGEAKLKAAEEVLTALKEAAGPLPPKRLTSPRALLAPTKRHKEEITQGLRKYHKNGNPVS